VYREKPVCSHLREGESVRVLVGRIEGGHNLLSWRYAKTKKLGGFCVSTHILIKSLKNILNQNPMLLNVSYFYIS